MYIILKQIETNIQKFKDTHDKLRGATSERESTADISNI